MAINIEVKYRLKELEARIKALEDRQSEVTITVPVEIQKEEKPNYKLCPKCGVKPAYYFHVRTCPGKKQEV